MFQSAIFRQFLACLLVLLGTLGYSGYGSDKTLVMKHVGFLCCCTTIMFFAAPLASLIHIIKAKSSESLPFPIIFMTFVVSSQWFAYGYLLGDAFIQVCIIYEYKVREELKNIYVTTDNFHFY